MTAYRFVRTVRAGKPRPDDVPQVELVDGLQNLLPAGTPRSVQTSASNLVDAYKWANSNRTPVSATDHALLRISDRAEPRESLRAVPVFGLGLEKSTVLLSTVQLEHFRRDGR